MQPAAILILLLLFAPRIWAEGPCEQQTPIRPGSAPCLGHPLDPHDVDVLTGRADREAFAPRMAPYVSIDGYGWMGWQTGEVPLGLRRGQFGGVPFPGFPGAWFGRPHRGPAAGFRRFPGFTPGPGRFRPAPVPIP